MASRTMISLSFAHDSTFTVHGHPPEDGTVSPTVYVPTGSGSAFLHFDSIETMTLFGLALVEEARKLLDAQKRQAPTLADMLEAGDADNAAVSGTAGTAAGE